MPDIINDRAKSAMKPLVRIADLTKSYGPTKALTDVSLSVAPGTIHALLGGNGSGKSTLIKCLAGVVIADSGTFATQCDDWDANTHSPQTAADHHFRFVHQQNTTFGDLTVSENLGFGGNFKRGLLGRIDWSAQRKHTRQVLERFHIPASPDDEMVNLGAAVQMLIAIARATQDISNSVGGLLVLDEPTASLPRHEVDFLLASLERLASSGQSILLVSHRLAEIERIGDEATVLRDGKVAIRLGKNELHQDSLVRAITGRDAAVKRRPRTDLASDVILRYEPDDNSIPLILRAGECLGVAGLLCSGRTSLLKRIFGAAPRGSDVVTVGEAVTPADDVNAAIRAGIAFVPEDRPVEALFPDRTLIDNLSITNLAAHSSGPLVHEASERRTATELLDNFSVRADSPDALISSLSGGNQQKVILARWLQRNPKVLLLDEPTQGIDIGAREEIHRLIAESISKGLAVVYVSSDFEELAEVSDRVVLMQGGRIVGKADGDGLTEEKLYQLVFAKESLE